MPPCGAVCEVPPENTVDGQRRRFMCQLPVDHDEPMHLAIVDLEIGLSATWPLPADQVPADATDMRWKQYKPGVREGDGS